MNNIQKCVIIFRTLKHVQYKSRIRTCNVLRVLVFCWWWNECQVIRWAALTWLSLHYSCYGGWKKRHSQANEYWPGSPHWVEIPTRPPFQRHRVDRADLDVDGPSAVTHSVPLGFVVQRARNAGDCGGCSRAPLGSTVQPSWRTGGPECHAVVLRYLEKHPKQVWNHYWTNSELLPRGNVKRRDATDRTHQTVSYYIWAEQKKNVPLLGTGHNF